MADILTVIILGLLVVAALVAAYVLWPEPKGPVLDPKRLIGLEGRMTSDLKAGEKATALVGPQEWTVTSSADIPKGSKVRVVTLEGLELVVGKL